MKKETLKTISIVTIYAIAMAFLESVVVYYIRLLYYPNGFKFPLSGFLTPQVFNVEFFREFFTLVMLLTVAMLAAKSFYTGFAYFWYAFAIWDIFYYIWLKVIINWPSSLMTWDILFLIPWVWIGPVIAPIVASLTMIIIAIDILYLTDKGYEFKIGKMEWAALIAGGLLQLCTFLYDYGLILINGNYMKDFLTLTTNTGFISEVSNYIPSNYNWILFAIGEVLYILAIISWHISTILENKKNTINKDIKKKN